MNKTGKLVRNVLRHDMLTKNSFALRSYSRVPPGAEEYDTDYYSKAMSGVRNRYSDRLDKMSEEQYREQHTFSRKQLIAQHSSKDGIPYEGLPEVQKNIDNAPKNFSAIQDWSEANFHPFIVETLEELKLKKPTPIQELTLGLVDRDMIACSETGSGKTFAFLLPIVQDFLAHPKRTSVGSNLPIKALIIQPTRELCQQVYKEALKLTMGTPIQTNLAYGQTPVRVQAKAVMAGTDILIATPGRLVQFLEDGVISLEQLQHLVIDEADQLLKMGFIESLNTLLLPILNINKNRTTKMFSATYSSNIQSLAKKFLKDDFSVITIGSVNRFASSVTQKFAICEGSSFEAISNILQLVQKNPTKTLVFANEQRTTELLYNHLSRLFPHTFVINGAKTQNQRLTALESFRRKNSTDEPVIMIATDLLARGIDITDIAHVINFDVPLSPDQYIHRIGRTGRTGRKGLATTIINMRNMNPQTRATLSAIRYKLNQSNIPIPQELVTATSFSKLSAVRGSRSTADQAMASYERLNPIEREELTNRIASEFNFEVLTKAKNSHHKPNNQQDNYGRRRVQFQKVDETM